MLEKETDETDLYVSTWAFYFWARARSYVCKWISRWKMSEMSAVSAWTRVSSKINPFFLFWFGLLFFRGKRITFPENCLRFVELETDRNLTFPPPPPPPPLANEGCKNNNKRIERLVEAKTKKKKNPPKYNKGNKKFKGMRACSPAAVYKVDDDVERHSVWELVGETRELFFVLNFRLQHVFLRYVYSYFIFVSSFIFSFFLFFLSIFHANGFALYSE